MSTAFSDYRQAVQTALARGNATEHTHRPTLITLLETLAPNVAVTNEPRRVACGAPDIIVERGAAPLGYVETKDVGASLDREEKSEQLQRYRTSLGNLVLTDYLEFRWYVGGEHRLTARLGESDRQGKIRQDRDGAEQVGQLLGAFLEEQAVTLSTPHELARRMAGLGRLIRDAILRSLRQEDKGGALHQQMEAFRDVLLHTLDAEQFADMYAQTICYGFFAARCHADKPRNFARENAAFHIPPTNPFLRRLFADIAGPELDTRVAWAVDDLVGLLRRCDMSAVLADFGRRTRREDPVVHFYETFLSQYDPRMREARGVYYTPEPVVSYIVRSIDHILKRDFQLKDGLADATKISVAKAKGGGTEEVHKVQILDPAAGTGSFLHGVIDQIHDSFAGNKGMWAGYVSEHLLPRLFGFELLMAPYAVAHMKLGLQLGESGYNLARDERLNVFLTNSLDEPHEPTVNLAFAGMIANEAKYAGRIKKEAPVMVVLGNPPYSGHSENPNKRLKQIDPNTTYSRYTKSGKLVTRKSGPQGVRFYEQTFIGKLLDDYKKVDGNPLGERNPKWLNDDYVKFIRFAQWRIERTGYGILAFITNHGYLDNLTFRGMRQSLMQTFDDIYILDLHGNANKKEICPDESKDENVFDIQQGVAIGIFVKRTRKKNKPATVRHADLWGIREDHSGNDTLGGGKYHWLHENDVTRTSWNYPSPAAPFYPFVPRDTKREEEYLRGIKITEIMPVNSVGIVTARDELTIHWTPDDVMRTVRDFATLPPERARKKYRLGNDAQDWKASLARDDLNAAGISEDMISSVLYRPFDVRHTYYTGKTRGFMCRPRPEVMRHMLAGENVGLITTRQTRDLWGIFATRTICTHKSCAAYDINSLFPLYLYSNGDLPRTLFEYQDGRRPNLAEHAVSALVEKLKLRFVPDGRGDLKKTFGPEDVFDYLYAVLHAPAYRERYAEFLKIDFPRVPLTSDQALFRKLCGLGAQLAGLHLMDRHGPEVARFPMAGEGEVENVRYTEPGQGAAQGRVWINKAQYFEGVTPEVWNLHIGGYQVCAKWVKDRKDRKLSYDDLERYRRIVSALSETLRLMREIDTAVPSWPLE